MTISARVNETDAVMEALRGLIRSALPAVVFSSLAARCVPVFSDGCHVVVEEDGLMPYRIERPLIDTGNTSAVHGNPNWARNSWSGQWVSDHMVQTFFKQNRAGETTGYRGSVLHLWQHRYHPTGTDIALAQLAVDYAVNVLRHEQGSTHPASRAGTSEVDTGHVNATGPGQRQRRGRHNPEYLRPHAGLPLTKAEEQ